MSETPIRGLELPQGDQPTRGACELVHLLAGENQVHRLEALLSARQAHGIGQQLSRFCGLKGW